MPKGPRGEKRQVDAIGLAVMIGKIATGQIDDTADATKSVISSIVRHIRNAARPHWPSGKPL